MRALAGAFLVLLGCRAEIPVGVFECDIRDDCPPGQLCGPAGLCVLESCTPFACRELDCELIDDGCGGSVECGGCDREFDTCGGGGIESVCGCMPVADCGGDVCGEVPDGCGNVVDCGGCIAPLGCTDNACGCTDESDPCEGRCGVAFDDCGVRRDCAACTGGLFCSDGVCGAAPCERLTLDDCGIDGLDCGPAYDKCDGVIDCGECATGVCGAGGVANSCGCSPTRTCGNTGAQCGTIDDGCGGSVTCGTCAPPTICLENQCECRDGYEPNEEASEAKDLGVRWTTSDANTSGVADIDWYFADYVNHPMLEVILTAAELRTGNFVVTVYEQCEALEAAPGCPMSEPVDDANGRGCKSPAPFGGGLPGSTVVRVTIAPTCSSGRLLLRVESAGIRLCFPYELVVSRSG